jgi:D-alanyl-D-alanine endopeptidase (penicillin-binding protein 7)
MILNNFKNFFTIENRTKYFTHILIYFFIASVVVFVLIIGNSSLDKIKNATAKEKTNFFENLALEGKGVVVFDVINNREIFSKNPDMPLPLASLTKVMTAVTTDGKLDDNQKVKITKEDLAPEGDSKLVVGDTWKAKDLRDFTLLTSSNDGALALAAVVEAKESLTSGGLSAVKDQFIKEMNETASKIGLLNSKFFNEHGLDREADRGGAYGSAHDMAILFEYTLKNYPEILEVTRYKNLEFTSDEKKYPAENTNVFVDKIPNIIASKTGYTDLAGGNLVIAFDAGLNRPIIISILGSTQEGRFTDALKLVEATIKQLPNL